MFTAVLFPACFGSLARAFAPLLASLIGHASQTSFAPELDRRRIFDIRHGSQVYAKRLENAKRIAATLNRLTLCEAHRILRLTMRSGS
jgi:hypothetical protein